MVSVSSGSVPVSQGGSLLDDLGGLTANQNQAPPQPFITNGTGKERKIQQGSVVFKRRAVKWSGLTHTAAIVLLVVIVVDSPPPRQQHTKPSPPVNRMSRAMVRGLDADERPCFYASPAELVSSCS